MNYRVTIEDNRRAFDTLRDILPDDVSRRQVPS